MRGVASRLSGRAGSLRQAIARPQGLACGRSHKRVALLCLLAIFFPFISSAQEVRVNGGFLADSLKIGEEAAYYLSAHYPQSMTVLFPDSTHSFAPFEYQRRQYFATKTTDGVSADSAIYYLTTFDVTRVQKLVMPVYVVQPQDCTVVDSPADSVLITQLVAHVPDTVAAPNLPLKASTAYQDVAYDLNFWLIVIAICVVVVLAVLIWIFFGKRIRRYFRARKLQKNHAAFVHAYDSFLRDLHAAFSAPKTESALVTWKKYMEQLESRPYTKLTTRETASLVKEPALREDLSAIDKAIYGHDTTVMRSLENLKSFANRQFSKRMKEVQHG